MTTETNHHYFNGHADSAPQPKPEREPVTRDEAIDWLTAAEHGWYGQLKFLERMREDLVSDGALIEHRVADALRAIISLNDAREALVDALSERVYRVCVSMRSEHVVYVRASNESDATEAGEYFVNRKFSAEFDGDQTYDYEVIESMLLDNDDHIDEDPHCEA